MKRLNIDVNKAIDLYVNQNMTLDEVAKIMKASATTIYYRFLEKNVNIRSRSESMKGKNPWDHMSTLKVGDVCKECGDKYKLYSDRIRCPSCRRGNYKKCRDKRPEHFRKQSRDFYYNNKEKCLEIQKAYGQQSHVKQRKTDQYMGKRDKIKAQRKAYKYESSAEKLANWRAANKDRADELRRIAVDVKWGAIIKPDYCPRCMKIPENPQSIYAHLDKSNNFLGFICSFCKGELKCRRNRGEDITDENFRKERKVTNE